MRRLALAVLLVVALAAPVQAQPTGVDGFETAIGALDCPGSFGSAGGTGFFGTSSPHSGSYDFVSRSSGSNQGSCLAMSGLGSLTGTYILTGWIRHEFFGGVVCNPTQAGAIVNVRNASATVVASVSFSCTNAGSDYQLYFADGSGTLVGSKVSAPVSTDIFFELKVTTGSGTGQIEGRFNAGSVQGPATGLTIANIDQVYADHSVLTGNSNQEFHFDDLVLLATSSYPGKTYVNMRKPDGNGGSGRNNWTKAATGTTSGSITTEWTSPQALSSLATDASKTTYATSVAADVDGQTATIANWDSGTPTPVISSATLAAIHGCRLDVNSERTGGTARSYGIYSYQNATKNTTTVTYGGASTMQVDRQLFGPVGSTLSDKLTYLNGLEVGGEKTTDTSGANMVIEDVWVQCAWSIISNSVASMWVQDDE